MYLLEQLFNDTIKTYKTARRKKFTFDGQAEWQPLKNLLTQYDSIVATEFKKIRSKLVTNIMCMPEKFIDGYGTEIMIPANHFIIQQVRIPTQDKPTLRKVFQIALNIGQWKGSVGSSKSNKYKELNTIHTYLNTSNIKLLSAVIDKKLEISIQNILLKVGK